MEKAIQIELTIGTGFCGDGTPIEEAARIQALYDIDAAAALQFGGFSRRSNWGGWLDVTGTLVTEPSVTYVILTDQPSCKAEKLAQFSRRVLQQRSVLLVVRQVEAQFISEGSNG